MRDFWVEPIAQAEFEASAAWYEGERDGLGYEFVAEVERTLSRIAHQAQFATAPVGNVHGGVVRREFVDRFPYVVYFVETTDARRVIMIRRGSADPARWRSRL